MKLAIIGSGISGLSSAYYLSKNHKVDLFEKEDHFGGHSHTIDIKIQDNIIPVDIGFIVFNKKTYPHLINFFEENNIAIEKSNMSFSVSVRGSEIEYCGKGISGIFSNKLNTILIILLIIIITYPLLFYLSKLYKKYRQNTLKNMELLGHHLQIIWVGIMVFILQL